MPKKYRFLKILLWIGIVILILWFLSFSIAPESILTEFSFMETQGFFLRLSGIFALGWAVLFLFVLKDTEKNIAILNGAILTAVFMIIFKVVYHIIVGTTGWIHWMSATVIFIYNLLLFLFKPRASKKTSSLPE